MFEGFVRGGQNKLSLLHYAAHPSDNLINLLNLCFLFMPPPFEEWWKGIKCYPCPCVRTSVRPSVIKIWCPLNNFWNTKSIQFKFGMLIFNIKTQVKFDLGYNPPIFTELWAFYKINGGDVKHSTQIGVRSITLERLHRFDSYLAYWYIISKHRSSSIWVTIHWFLTELWAIFNVIAHLASVSYGHISSLNMHCFFFKPVYCEIIKFCVIDYSPNSGFHKGFDRPLSISVCSL